jgi:hypothetical protein
MQKLALLHLRSNRLYSQASTGDLVTSTSDKTQYLRNGYYSGHGGVSDGLDAIFAHSWGA